MTNHFLPYLRPISKCKGLYNIDLCYLEEESQVPPKITFVTEENQKVQDLDSLGISGAELVKSSFQNLYNIDIEVSHAEEKTDGFLVFSSEHCAEKILDKEFLRSVSEKLNTNRLTISIPVRHSLLICDSDKENAKSKLYFESQKLYNDFSREAISKLVFELEDGVIQSAIQPTISVDEINEMKSDPGSYSVTVTKVKLFQELYNVRVVVEAEKVDDLQNGVFYTILEIIKENRGKANFENSIEIISSSDSLDKSGKQVQKIRELFDKVEEKYSSLYRSGSDAIKLSFQFNKDFVSGNSHKKIIKLLK